MGEIDRPDEDGLTGKQRAFVNAYCGVAGYNASEAARIAGYADPRPEACHLLRHPRIKAIIARKHRESAMDADELLSRLGSVARTDISALEAAFETVGTGRDRRRVLMLAKVRELGLGHLVRKIVPTKFGDTVELHDPLRAAELIGRHLALFTDKLSVETFDPSKLTDDQLKAIIKGARG